jgi:putative ABC transport system permease protein
MAWWTWALLATALATAIAVAIEMARRPILARMALRNASRRPKQTWTVVAGLLVGTAIISAALVAGGSAASAIRGYVYQSLGEIDESVAIEGYPYFPQTVATQLRSDPALAGGFDAVSVNAIWAAAVDNPRTDLFEPQSALVGFEPQADAGFGDFELRGGGHTSGSQLQPGEAIITQHLADQLEARPGDTLRLSLTPPLDPLLPEITILHGNVTASVGPTSPLGLPIAPVQPVPSQHGIEVRKGATRFTAAIGWEPAAAPGVPPTTALRLDVVEPDGAVHSASASPGDATRLLVVNVTSEPDATLQDGSWTVRVSSTAAVQQPSAGVAFVGYPVYDLALLRERARALQQQFDLPAGLDPLEDDFSDRRTVDLTVLAVTTGGRGDQFDFRDAVFLDLTQAQELFGREGEVNLVKFSNPGGPVSGIHGSSAQVARLNASLQRIQAAYPDVASIQSLEVQPLKQKYIAIADEAGQTLTGLLVFAGSLSIITGLLLITNIFTMLAEERRSELGMARAVGLTRSDLVRLFLFEGSLYAVVAAALGAVLGLGLAYGMIQILNAIIGRVASELTFPPIPFQPRLSALLIAFSVGALLTFITIAVASTRSSRLNVVRAIRRLDEPERTGSLVRGLAWGLPVALSGLGAVVLGFLDDAVTHALVGNHALSLIVFGALAIAVGVLVALRPAVPRRWLLPTVAGALAVFYAATYFLMRRYPNIAEANVVGPLRGVILTLCVVVLVIHADRPMRAFARLLSRSKRLRAVALPAMSYPLHRKFRTGMTLAMFSVVILSIGFFSIFGGLFEVDPARQTGGYDVEGRTTLNVPDLAPYDRGLVAAGTFTSTQHLVVYGTEDPEFITVDGERTGSFSDFRHQVFGYDAGFVQDQEFTLLFRDPRFATDEAAYQAVLDDPGLIITSYQYSTDARNQDLANEIGDTLEMHLGNETLAYTIVGIQEQYHYPGIFLPQALVKGLFPTTEDLYLYRTAHGVDPQEAAKDLERNYRDVGMDASAIKVDVLREQESFRQILGAMKLFLGLGLIVGVLSLGIVTSRSVLERRQEIGMLRALGYTGRQIRRIFFLEVTATLLAGALVGIACAIVVTYGLWWAIIRDLNYPYQVPFGEIGILLAASYLVALLATAAPIGRSAKVAPAEALRYLE